MMSNNKETTKRRPTNGFDKRPQDINRKGAPEKEWTWSQLCREAMDEVDPTTGFQYKKIAVEKAREKATAGDMPALEHFANRIDGRAKESVDMKVSGTVSLVQAIHEADE